MSRKQDLRHDSAQWIFWGHWPNCGLFASIWLRWPECTIFKELRLPLDSSMKFLKGDFYVVKDDIHWLREVAIDSIEGRGQFLENLFRSCERRMREFRNRAEKENLRAFVVDMVDYAGLTVTVELTALSLERYFEDKAAKAGVKSSDFMAMMKPKKKTPLMKFFADLQTLRAEDVDVFAKKYCWVGIHGFEGEGLTKAKVLAELEKPSERRREKQQPVPRSLKHIYSAASELIYLRSAIIETLNVLSYRHIPSLKTLAAQHGLTYDEIISLTWQELLSLIDEGALPPDIKTRRKDFGLVRISKHYELLTGEAVDRELAIHQEKISGDVQELHGMAAHPGRVTGLARIISDAHDLHHVRANHIIIASETTVDYVPAMERAAGFVTDQGGITSHAAVIARELRKPCVIGTKHATKVFKDGDLVEVDAEKGVVRKIYS